MPSWSKDAKFYADSAWKRFAKAYLAAHPSCVVPGCGAPATHADHIRAIAAGGDPWGAQNLQPLCTAHHNQKTAIFDRPSRPSAKTRLSVRGADASGMPLDPLHHWNKK